MTIMGFPGGSVKNLPANAGDTVRPLIQEDPTCHGVNDESVLECNHWSRRPEPALPNERAAPAVATGGSPHTMETQCSQK